VTQVTGKGCARLVLAVVLLTTFARTTSAQTLPETSASPPKVAPPHVPGPAEALYLKLQTVGLDPARIYHVREASLDRPALHVLFEDGEIGFTEDVAGHITGAFFEGDGELLLTPPNQVERASLTLFTGMAILEERFSSAYIRFNDDTFSELQPYLRASQEPAAFHARWNKVAGNLAEQDALRLLETLSRTLPASHPANPPASLGSHPDDRMLHLRVQGIKLGSFDVYFDTIAGEQVWAGRLRTVDEMTFYDLWTSFTPRSANSPQSKKPARPKSEDVVLSAYEIRAEVNPPTTLTATAVVHAEVRHSGDRVLYFELSRFLQVKEVQVDGEPVEFINNPAVDGTQLARRGNDLVAVVFPDPLQQGRRLNIRFSYSGDVLSEAGGGLLYVGARGTWYPNRGLAMSNFDLQFRYPAGWTLVATGKRVTAAVNNPDSNSAADGQVAHWASERPMVLAGFNLGRYDRASSHAGEVAVEAYAARAMEKDFPHGSSIISVPSMGPRPGTSEIVTPVVTPSPSRNAQKVADYGARAIDFFSERFGPYPYSSLELTQMPGRTSQGWPGLVFLSSYAFLTPEQTAQISPGSLDSALNSLILPHETAHQWWGDLVNWQTYRDQWIVEALANYSALMMVETSRPQDFHNILQKYRDDLLVKNRDGEPLRDAGPVTLGLRLSSSHFPNGYEAISYGRGTWLFHMLRNMLRDTETRQAQAKSGEEPFVRALRKVRERYAGKAITTRELFSVFEEDLPKPLCYEGRRSLDWFVQGWVEGVSLPHLNVQNLKFSRRPQGTEASGMILQTEAPQDLVTPVPVYAVSDGGTHYLGTVLADGPQTPFHFAVPADTRKIVLDPHQTLLSASK
jgi:peptidase M1-like protein